MFRRAIGLSLLTFALSGTAFAQEQPYDASDTLAAIDQASQEEGVSRATLFRIVSCEDSTLDPYAVGDHGTSFGPVQLHRGGGEITRFYDFGYWDVFDPYQSIRFLAQELSFGRAGAWSCR